MMKIILAALLATAFAAHGQQKGTHAIAAQHTAMTKRGEQAMGFSQEKTTHHFRLFKDGGAIEVTANDAKDTASRDQIRQHLSHIAQKFAAGDFNVPMFIHGVDPPGAATMTDLRSQIHYLFQKIDSGARVRIETTNPQATEAIHAFLRFQIAEHKTGDSVDISEDVAKK